MCEFYGTRNISNCDVEKSHEATVCFLALWANFVATTSVPEHGGSSLPVFVLSDTYAHSTGALRDIPNMWMIRRNFSVTCNLIFEGSNTSLQLRIVKNNLCGRHDVRIISVETEEIITKVHI